MKKIMFFAMLMVLLSSMLCACSETSQGIGETGISLDEYNQLRLNMSYQQSIDIIGGKGQEISSSESREEDYIRYTHVYRFEGESSGYAELEFTVYSYYDKIDFKQYLTGKSQKDLK